MNQTVLLAGINDDADVLEALFRGLVRARVRPYYLLQADPVRGTGHLRTPLAKGVAIIERLQGRLTGIALPKLDLRHARAARARSRCCRTTWSVAARGDHAPHVSRRARHVRRPARLEARPARPLQPQPFL